MPYQELNNEVQARLKSLFKSQAFQNEFSHFLLDLRMQTFQPLKTNEVCRFLYSFLLYQLPFKNNVKIQQILKVNYFPLKFHLRTYLRSELQMFQSNRNCHQDDKFRKNRLLVETRNIQVQLH